MFRTISTVDPVTAPSSPPTTGGWTRPPTASRRGSPASTAPKASSRFPLWLVLFLISGVVFAYVLFFADPAEGPVTQGMLMGSVTVVISLLLQLLVFFDHPHGDGVGRLQPTAMERTLRLVDTQLDAVGLDVTRSL